MSSRNGFARADIDVGLLDDPKMKRLWSMTSHDTEREWFKCDGCQDLFTRARSRCSVRPDIRPAEKRIQ